MLLPFYLNRVFVYPPECFSVVAALISSRSHILIQTVIQLSRNEKKPLHRNTNKRDNYLASKSVSM